MPSQIYVSRDYKSDRILVELDLCTEDVAALLDGGMVGATASIPGRAGILIRIREKG